MTLDAVAQELTRALPGVITSKYRPSGTHEYGAIDIAPRFKPGVGLYHKGILSCQVPYLWERVQHLAHHSPLSFQFYFESDHVHLHDLKQLPSRLRDQLPLGRVFVELFPSCPLDAFHQGPVHKGRSSGRRFTQLL